MRTRAPHADRSDRCAWLRRTGRARTHSHRLLTAYKRDLCGWRLGPARSIWPARIPGWRRRNFSDEVRRMLFRAADRRDLDFERPLIRRLRQTVAWFVTPVSPFGI